MTQCLHVDSSSLAKTINSLATHVFSKTSSTTRDIMFSFGSICRHIVSKNFHNCLSITSKHASSSALIYKKFGDPVEVLERADTPYLSAESKQLPGANVLVKFLASPINPADINTIQGQFSSMLCECLSCLNRKTLSRCLCNQAYVTGSWW